MRQDIPTPAYSSLRKTGQQHGRLAGSRSTFQLDPFLTVNLFDSLYGSQWTVIDQTNYSFINLIGMNFSFSHQSEEQQKNQQDSHTIAAVDESLHNITDGGEFLDDALRMIDQPLMYTKESVAPGSPKGL